MASVIKQQEPALNPHELHPISAVPAKPEPRRDDSAGDLCLGVGVQFEGKLTFKGTVRIDAKFVGSIVTNDVLVVGENAKVDAEITCGTVQIAGEVNGNIKAQSGVELQRSARVHGNVETASLAVEKGAVLQGKLQMTGAA